VKIQVSKDLGSGLMFLAFGAILVAGAGNYTIGTAAEMGPGFMPLCAGLFISVIGVVLLGRAALHAPDRADLYPIPLLILCAAICIFALLFSSLGLVAAVVLLSVLSARAGSDFSIGTALCVGIAVAVLAATLFIWGLGLPFPAWPRFWM
jgi:hypothetical protein